MCFDSIPRTVYHACMQIHYNINAPSIIYTWRDPHLQNTGAPEGFLTEMHPLRKDQLGRMKEERGGGRLTSNGTLYTSLWGR